MKTLYVGGNHFFNRFSNLEAAVERAEHDDIIEICKDCKDVSVTITKNITINGNCYHITPADGKTAFDCTSFVTMKNLQFDCVSRTNAIIIRGGGMLKDIRTYITNPGRSLFPTIIQKGGTLTIKDSNIIAMETHTDTVTFIRNCIIKNHCDGFIGMDTVNHPILKFQGTTHISNSIVSSVFLEGYSTVLNTTLSNFNKATGTVVMKSCKLQPKEKGRPINSRNIVPYALNIASGNVIMEDYSSSMNADCIGIYMTGGSLNMSSTRNYNDQVRHLIKGGSVIFNDVVDDGFYEIEDAHCSIVRSGINTSVEIKSAMEELNDMIGLGSVKKQLRTIINTINVNMQYPEKDFGFSHHMIFAGDPGTGKTTVAKLVARALFEIGAIAEDKFMEVPASQLIKGFVGQTGEHVESVMKEALGGVLFIDEAYELTVKEGQNTFNNDALAVLLRYMEDHRDNLIVIAAGYEKEMRQFLASNVGLARRFQWVTFEDYTPAEMTDIFMSMSYKFDEYYDFSNPEAKIERLIGQLTGHYLSHPDMNGRITNGGNGGLVRNLFQQVIFARNNRVSESPGSTMKITFEDVMTGFHEELGKAENIVECNIYM